MFTHVNTSIHTSKVSIRHIVYTCKHINTHFIGIHLAPLFTSMDGAEKTMMAKATKHCITLGGNPTPPPPPPPPPPMSMGYIQYTPIPALLR